MWSNLLVQFFIGRERRARRRRSCTYLYFRVVWGNAVADEAVGCPETVEYVHSQRRVSVGHARQQPRGHVERRWPTADDGELDRQWWHAHNSTTTDSMQATLNAAALKCTSLTHSLLTCTLIQRKAFVRALTCLSRYGDDLVVYADAQHLTLSTTNSSLSAYCRFRYGRMFFSRYRVGGGMNGAGPSTAGSPSEPEDVRGQLLVKVRFTCTQVCVCIDGARRHCYPYSNIGQSKRQSNAASWSS